jgi:hypothetical protein
MPENSGMDCVRSNPKRLAEALTTETEESCTTYNMLKVGVHIHRTCTVFFFMARE